MTELSGDPAYDRRSVRLLHWAALCGQGLAVVLLSGVHDEGVLGVEKNPDLGTCLERIYEAYDRPYDSDLFSRGLIAGRVWGCGVRMEELQE